MSLLSIFVTAILPVVAVATVGFLLGRYQGVEADALNTVTVFVLAPALVVHSLTTTELAGGTLVRLTAGTVAFSVAMVLLAVGVGRLQGRTEPVLGAFVLVTAFPNVGNYGIPLAEFAFGAAGRSTAILVTAVQGVLLYTMGVYVAARGGKGDALSSMRRVFAVPLVYAVVVALAARWLGVVPPTDSPLMETVGVLGEAAIPVMLLILGIQLSDVNADGTLRTVGVATGLKLLVAPVVGLALALALDFADPTIARAFVLLCAAPAAVTTIILVGAFGRGDGDAAGEFVSAAVFVTTVLSVGTVTVLVALLQSGQLL